LAFVYTEDESGTLCFVKTTLSHSQINMLDNMIGAFVSDATTKNSFGWKLTSTEFCLFSGINKSDGGKPIFTCNDKGIYVKGSGEFTGKITAESGEIANFDINENLLMTKGYLTYKIDKIGQIIIEEKNGSGVAISKDFISLGPSGGF
jgi:hypothetical protein